MPLATRLGDRQVSRKYRTIKNQQLLGGSNHVVINSELSMTNKQPFRASFWCYSRVGTEVMGAVASIPWLPKYKGPVVKGR